MKFKSGDVVLFRCGEWDYECEPTPFAVCYVIKDFDFDEIAKDVSKDIPKYIVEDQLAWIERDGVVGFLLQNGYIKKTDCKQVIIGNDGSLVAYDHITFYAE